MIVLKVKYVTFFPIQGKIPRRFMYRYCEISLKKNNLQWSRILQLPLGMFFFAFAFPVFAAENSNPASLQPISKIHRAFEQSVPLAIVNKENQKATCVNIRLRLNEETTELVPDDALNFLFDPAADPDAVKDLRSQFWISALAAAMVWQEPWISSSWMVRDVPQIDGPAVGAALAVGMIAVSASVEFPKDTVILGCLNPDGTLGSAISIIPRLKAVAASGFKRVIIPSRQHLEPSLEGEMINLDSLGRKLGLECIFVDDVAEAASQTLHRHMPDVPDRPTHWRYGEEIFNILDDDCKLELSKLQSSFETWPKRPEQLAALSETEQALWRSIMAGYNMGMDFYRLGQMYVAREKFIMTNAKLRAVATWKSANTTTFDYQVYDTRANDLRKQFQSLMVNPPADRDELQTALALAEESDWIYRMAAKIEGAQAAARQAFGPKSTASPDQKSTARIMLQNIVEESSYLIGKAIFYGTLAKQLTVQEPVPIYNRAQLWLPQLIPAYLANADFLILGIKQDANRYKESLLFDPRLAAFVQALKDAKADWTKHVEEKNRLLAKLQPQSVTRKIGFFPGKAYAPPTPPVPHPPPKSLSDTVLCLAWVNQYCEAAFLAQKYLRLKSEFNPTTHLWKIQDRAALQNMLQCAEVGARRGIAMSLKVGINPSVFALAYESASALRNSNDDQEQLEALRQYWRCALLGNMCWQLGYIPRAKAVPADATSDNVSNSNRN